MFYWFAYYFLKLLSIIFFPFTVRGREYIPQDGAFIFASNHLSNLDPVIIGLGYGKKLNYVAKDSLFQNKLFAFVLNHVRAFPIKRQSADIRSLREAMRRLKNGEVLLVFPQGTRSSDLDEQNVQKGIGFLAAKCGVPIVPVYIEGSDRVLPPGAKWFKRFPINVKIGASVQFSTSDPYIQISQRIIDAIKSLG